MLVRKNFHAFDHSHRPKNAKSDLTFATRFTYHPNVYHLSALVERSMQSLKERRIALLMTQVKLASALGVTPITISRWERGGTIGLSAQRRLMELEWKHRQRHGARAPGRPRSPYRFIPDALFDRLQLAASRHTDPFPILLLHPSLPHALWERPQDAHTPWLERLSVYAGAALPVDDYRRWYVYQREEDDGPAVLMGIRDTQTGPTRPVEPGELAWEPKAVVPQTEEIWENE